MTAEGGEGSVVVQASSERVWRLVTDVTRTGEWSPENIGAVWLDGATGPAIGARFKGTNRRGKTKWASTCEVIAAEPGREFAFATGGAAKPETVWRYVLEPLGDRETRITESFQLVKPLGAASRFVTRITTGVRDRRADLEDNVRQSLARIKEILEATDRAG
jgi:uncharacterized protein YndB with AHSA1/START domain